MKKVIFISALALAVSSASVAMASLSSDIQSMGMCKAVSHAVSNGTTVSSIVGQSTSMGQAQQQALLTALYASGASDDAIRVSAEKAKISDLALVQAYNAHTKGCVDNPGATQNVTSGATKTLPADDTQAYTPASASDASLLAASTTGQADHDAFSGGNSVASAAPAIAAAAPVAAAATTGQAARQATSGAGEVAATTPAEPASWTIEAGGRTMMLGDYWNTFYENYKKVGIDETAILAIKEGIRPDAFMEGGLALDDLNPQNLIKAMYCAGYKGDDIKKACDQFEISELVLVAGFKKSKEECSDHVTDTQAYTPVAGGPTMASVPAGSSGGSSYAAASPNAFPAPR